MLEFKGDIWRLYADGFHLIVPTNIGWTKDYSNVMGRGIAYQVKERFKHIPKQYGVICKYYKEFLGVIPLPKERLLMFPTKPLNSAEPHLSWQGGSTMERIELSCKSLYTLVDEKNKLISYSGGDKNFKIALPMVGCGNGGLNESEVLPLLHKYFDEFDNITLVTYG